MNAQQKQCPTQIDNTFAVEAESFGSCASCRSIAENQGVVFAPAKMLVPIVLARVEKRSHVASERILGFYFFVLARVAARASKGEIVHLVCTAFDNGNDVFDGK